MTDALCAPLLSLMTCPLCLCRYDQGLRSPRFLACHHSVCGQCVDSAPDRTPLQCSDCGVETTLTQPLPQNHQLMVLLQNVGMLERSASLLPCCDTHGAPRQFWCSTCQVTACRDCLVVAHRTESGHHTRDVREAEGDVIVSLQGRLGGVQAILEQCQQLREERRLKLQADVEACQNLLTLLTAKQAALEKTSPLQALRESLDSLQNQLEVPDILQRHDEVARKLADLEDRCERYCMTYDTTPRVSRSHSPIGRAATPPGGSTSSGSRSNSISITVNNRIPTPEGAKRRNFIRAVTEACTSHLFKSSSTPRSAQVTAIPAPLPANTNPRYFLRFSTDGSNGGGGGGEALVVIETRPEVAPRLCAVFASGCRGARGTYAGAAVLRCVPGWWVQVGAARADSSDGPAAASADDSGDDMSVWSSLAEADAQRLQTRPGAVEMLSARLGDGGKWLVGSQFFLHVRSYSFTNVFGYVVEGLESVARLASTGDAHAQYAPRRRITITECGQYTG